MDVLSQVLQQIRLSGAVLFRSNFWAPWCIASPAEGEVVHELAQAQAHLISFHVVLKGRIWARLGGGDVLSVDAGEVLLIPHGDAHLIGDSLDRLPVGTLDFLGGQCVTEARDVHWGDGGERSRLLCGYLACDRAAFSPLFKALPRLFKVRLAAESRTPESDPLLGFAEREAISSRQGANGFRLRVAELMFVEALRRYMESIPATEHGWLAGLRDPVVGRAMAMLHDAPARRWTVDALAKANAISRSALAERFGQTLGEAPMHYLARWRMLLAACRLRESRDRASPGSRNRWATTRPPPSSARSCGTSGPRRRAGAAARGAIGRVRSKRRDSA